MCPGIRAGTSYYFSESPGQPFKKIISLSIFGCAAFSLLPWAFSSCREQELLSVAVYRLLITVAALVAEKQTSGAIAQGLSSCGTQLRLQLLRGLCCGPGIKLVSLHWYADFHPLYHQGSPGKPLGK